MILVSLSYISAQNNQPMEKTEQVRKQLINHLATHPEATIWYKSSDTQLQIFRDASYLPEPNAHNRIGGNFFMDKKTATDKPIFLNNASHT